MLRQPNVASAIVGASRPEQVHANASASGIELDAQTRSRRSTRRSATSSCAEPMELPDASAGGQRFVFGDNGDQGQIRSCCSTASPTRRRAGRRRRSALSAAGYRAIVPYLRGYHRDTIVAGRGYGSREIGEDAIRLLDALGSRQALCSSGTTGAPASSTRRAAQAPERVRALVRRRDPAPAQDQPLARAALARAALHHAAPADAARGWHAATTSPTSTC